MLDEVQIEHRLTTIEGKIEAGFMQMVSATNDLTTHVKIQNHRIDRLEQLRTQLFAIVAVILALAPFVFYALNYIVRP